MIAQRRGADGLYYFHANFHEVKTFTNLATGKSITIDRRLTDRDAKVRFDADGTVVLTEAVSGPAKVIGPDGRPLFLDAGIVAWEVLLDADLQVLDLLGLVRDTGRSDTAGRDFCVDFLTSTCVAVRRFVRRQWVRRVGGPARHAHDGACLVRRGGRASGRSLSCVPPLFVRTRTAFGRRRRSNDLRRSAKRLAVPGEASQRILDTGAAEECSTIRGPRRTPRGEPVNASSSTVGSTTRFFSRLPPSSTVAVEEAEREAGVEVLGQHQHRHMWLRSAQNLAAWSPSSV